jgi:hypothetical protein
LQQIRTAYTDGQDRILMVTHTWNGLSDNHPLGVFYHHETGHWALFHEDGAPISTGAAYNIEWYPADTYHYVDMASTSNIYMSRVSRLDNPALNGNPSAIVLVTNRWTEYYCPRFPFCSLSTPRTNSGWGVIYENDIYAPTSWNVFTSDAYVPVPVGAQLNIIIAATSS